MTSPGDDLMAVFAAWREDIDADPFTHEQHWLDRVGRDESTTIGADT